MTEPHRTSFDDPRTFLSLPRVSGLVLSPDGTRLVCSMTTPNAEGTRFGTALWEVDPEGLRPARRLTRGAQGERAPAFTPDGDVLFVSARPDPDTTGDDEPPASLWLLPSAGGEARPVGTRPGGVAAPAVAADSGDVLVRSMTMPGARTADEDRERRTARKDQQVTAVLHSGYPVRYWDHDLGPDQPRLLLGLIEGDTGRATDGEERIEWRDLTPEPGPALYETHAELSPDGTTAVTGWSVAVGHAVSRSTVVVVDTASGDRRPLLDDPAYEFFDPRISPDGVTVAVLRERRTTPTTPPRVDLVLVPLAGGPVRPLTAGWDRWPAEVRWLPDATALLVTADQDGRRPLFRVSAADGTVTRLTADDGAYASPCPAPDGRTVYALRDSVGEPPAPVRLDTTTPDQSPVPLVAPAPAPELPGRVAEVRTRAVDGTPLRAWLALPSGEGPAPLLVWIHGGPLGSWNGWHWRWNPWLMVARGYAVLLPDPALSTGYGQEFVQRGWGTWGDRPYTDVLTLTDAALRRPDVDPSRTAAMGGSFGGYLANWIAGHTDRFDAIVTHAGLWALDQFGPTTDVAYYWTTEMTEAMARANSPHHHVDKIRTPMLVIHGDKDYRVPVGEALRLWFELSSRQPDPDRSPHRFLYFPDENHWVLSPGHAVVWYETVLAFLGRHLLGQEFEVPELLR